MVLIGCGTFRLWCATYVPQIVADSRDGAGSTTFNDGPTQMEPSRSKFRPYSRQMLRDLRELVRRNVRMFKSLTFGSGLRRPRCRHGLPRGLRGSAVQLVRPGRVHAVVRHRLHLDAQRGHPGQRRTAIRHLRGAWGEENTRSELSAARGAASSGAGWTASLSRWRPRPRRCDTQRRGGRHRLQVANHADTGDVAIWPLSADKVQRRAEALAAQVLRAERGPSRLRAGSAGHTRRRLCGDPSKSTGHRLGTGARHRLRGRSHLRRWLRDLDGDPVAKGAGAELVKRLQEFRAGVTSSQSKVRA